MRIIYLLTYRLIPISNVFAFIFKIIKLYSYIDRLFSTINNIF